MRVAGLFGLPVAVLLVAAAAPVQAQTPVPVGVSAENAAFSLSIDSYTLRPRVVGEAAPRGAVFMVVRGMLANRSTKASMSLAAVQEVFALDLGAVGAAHLHPLSDATADRFWGGVALRAGEKRPIEMVFAVPAGRIEYARLVYYGQPAKLAVNLLGRPPPPVPAVAEAKNQTARLAIESVAFAATMGNESAPSGMRFLTVKLRHTNLRGVRRPFIIARYMVLVEDGQYIRRPDRLTAVGTPFIVRRQAFPAGMPVAGRLVFLVPERSGHLALHYNTRFGRLGLDLTPELKPSPPPEPLSGPEYGTHLSASLYSAVEPAGPTPPQPGQRYLVLDIGLKFNADPMSVFRFAPGRRLALIDDAGKVHRPVAIAGGLDHGLRNVEIWPGQPVRGKIAFAVPSGADAPRSFVLEVQGPRKYLTLALPSVIPKQTAPAGPAPTVVQPTPEAPPASFDAALAKAGGPSAFGRMDLRIIKRRWSRLKPEQQGAVLKAFAMVTGIGPEISAVPALKRTVMLGRSGGAAEDIAVGALAENNLDGVALAKTAAALNLPAPRARELLDAVFRDRRPNDALSVDGDGRLRVKPAATAGSGDPLVVRQMRELKPDLSREDAKRRSEDDAGRGLKAGASLAGAAHALGVPVKDLMVRSGISRDRAGRDLLRYLTAHNRPGSDAERRRRVAEFTGRQVAALPAVEIKPPPEPDPKPTPDVTPDRRATIPPPPPPPPPQPDPDPITVTPDPPAKPAKTVVAVAINPLPPTMPAPDPRSWTTPPRPPAADPAPVPERSRESRIARLLGDAEKLFGKRKLAAPRGGSALDRYRSVLRLDPGNAQATAGIGKIVGTYIRWGRGKLGSGDLKRAAVYFRRAIGADGRHVAARSYLALTHQRAGRAGQAAKSYRKALSLDPGAGYLYRDYGLMLYKSGRYAEAAEILAKAGTHDARDPAVHLYRGYAYGQTGDWRAAARSFEAGLRIAPGNASLRRELGFSQLQLKRYRTAVDHLDRARSRNAGDPFVHLYLGLAYRELGDQDRANAAMATHRRLLKDALRR